MSPGRAGIARRLARFDWPRPVRAALARLSAGGHRAYLVGGAVRDVLLERPPGEAWDVATDRTPDEVADLFERVEPIGLRHGTLLLIVDGVRIECTTFRREGEYVDARHPERVEYTSDPAEDLARRDLTVNAMAYDPEHDEWLDPFGGRRDLEAGVLRAVGDPVARFREDALRPLRVARFVSMLGMEPEPATRAALSEVRDRAEMVALERVRVEFDRLLAGTWPSRGLSLLHECGLLALWMPELDRCAGVPQNRFHEHDVFVHSLLACDAAPAGRPRVRWAALLHDLGKPDTRVAHGEGEASFRGHAELGAELARRLLVRLRVPAARRARVVHLVREHMFDLRPEWGDAAVRRWLRRVGPEAVDDLFALREADAIATGRPAPSAPPVEALRARVAAVLAEAHALKVRDLAVDGHDVMRVLRMAPGRAVGEVLAALLEEVLEDPRANTRAHLLARLQTRARAQRGA